MHTTINDFLAAISDCQTTAELLTAFRDHMATLGFTAPSYTMILDSSGRSIRGVASRLSSEATLIADVIRSALPVDFDPVIARALRRLEPFHWPPPETAARLSERQQHVHEAERTAGFLDGIAVPVMTRPNELALFLLSARDRTFDLKPSDYAALKAICRATHERFEELIAMSQTHATGLSRREREVLAHVAAGETNKTIAKSIGVAPSTVDTLLRRIFLKLNVDSRVEAALIYSRMRTDEG